jgi:hypothetical protein
LPAVFTSDQVIGQKTRSKDAPTGWRETRLPPPWPDRPLPVQKLNDGPCTIHGWQSDPVRRSG